MHECTTLGQPSASSIPTNVASVTASARSADELGTLQKAVFRDIHLIRDFGACSGMVNMPMLYEKLQEIHQGFDPLKETEEAQIMDYQRLGADIGVIARMMRDDPGRATTILQDLAVAAESAAVLRDRIGEVAVGLRAATRSDSPESADPFRNADSAKFCAMSVQALTQVAEHPDAVAHLASLVPALVAHGQHHAVKKLLSAGGRRTYAPFLRDWVVAAAQRQDAAMVSVLASAAKCPDKLLATLLNEAVRNESWDQVRVLLAGGASCSRLEPAQHDKVLDIVIQKRWTDLLPKVHSLQHTLRPQQAYPVMMALSDSGHDPDHAGRILATLLKTDSKALLLKYLIRFGSDALQVRFVGEIAANLRIVEDMMLRHVEKEVQGEKLSVLHTLEIMSRATKDEADRKKLRAAVSDHLAFWWLADRESLRTNMVAAGRAKPELISGLFPLLEERLEGDEWALVEELRGLAQKSRAALPFAGSVASPMREGQPSGARGAAPAQGMPSVAAQNALLESFWSRLASGSVPVSEAGAKQEANVIRKLDDASVLGMLERAKTEKNPVLRLSLVRILCLTEKPRLIDARGDLIQDILCEGPQESVHADSPLSVLAEWATELSQSAKSVAVALVAAGVKSPRVKGRLDSAFEEMDYTMSQVYAAALTDAGHVFDIAIREKLAHAALQHCDLSGAVAFDKRFESNVALHKAIGEGSLDEAMRLLTSTAIHEGGIGQFGRTPLMTALLSGHEKLIELCLTQAMGTGLDSRDAGGKTALGHAVEKPELSKYWSRLIPPSPEYRESSISQMKEALLKCMVRGKIDEARGCHAALLEAGQPLAHDLPWAAIGHLIRVPNEAVREWLAGMVQTLDWKAEYQRRLIIDVLRGPSCDLKEVLKGWAEGDGKTVRDVVECALNAGVAEARCRELLRLRPEAHDFGPTQDEFKKDFPLLFRLLSDEPDQRIEAAGSHRNVGDTRNPTQSAGNEFVRSTSSRAAKAGNADAAGLPFSRVATGAGRDAVSDASLPTHSASIGSLDDAVAVIVQRMHDSSDSAVGKAPSPGTVETLRGVLGQGKQIDDPSKLLATVVPLLAAITDSQADSGEKLKEIVTLLSDQVRRKIDHDPRPNVFVRAFRFLRSLFSKEPYWLALRCMPAGNGSSRQWTPIEWADKAGHHRLRDLLLQCGKRRDAAKVRVAS